MSAPRPIEDMLSQFPGPITLRSSDSLRMMFVTLFLAVSPIALIYIGILGRGLNTGHPLPDVWRALVMFSCAALFLTLLRRAIVQLKSGSLRLDEAGFESTGYRRTKYLWSDVDDFHVGRLRLQFRIKPPKGNLEASPNGGYYRGRVAWLPDTYGYSFQDLAKLMSVWQARAAKK